MAAPPAGIVASPRSLQPPPRPGGCTSRSHSPSPHDPHRGPKLGPTAWDQVNTPPTSWYSGRQPTPTWVRPRSPPTDVFSPYIKGPTRTGGSQQINLDGHFKKPPMVHERNQSSSSEVGPDGSRDPVHSDLKNSHSYGDVSTSDQEIFGKSGDDLTISNGRTKNPVSWELDENSSPLDEVMHQKQIRISIKASGVASKTRKVGTAVSHNSLGEKHVSSSIDRDTHTTTEIVSGKKTKNKHRRKKKEDSQSDAFNQFWWLKLPYVLAIFLHRGSNRKEFKGLYSLKLDSSSEESHSYAVAFEDRADATNFCYLLESFFEDLDDFSADIVPLSIQEVHDAVKSGTLKVIVVRKGQLQLYAGQPLAEAEVQLRSMLD